MWQPIENAKHDENEILIKTTVGVVSAWWCVSGSEWVCYDDAFAIPETSDMMWMPLQGE